MIPRPPFASCLAVPFLVAALAAGPAVAEVPAVVTDIAPVQSLVAQVMSGLADPEVLVGPGASPHGYALRPSQARALQSADLVVWIGPELTPWLVEPVETLAADADSLALIDADGTTVLPFRTGATFEPHEHAHGQGEAAEEHDPDAEAEGHDHGGTDPHAWLDPGNGVLWLDLIAAELSRLDPENAGTYAANAAAGRAAIETVEADLAAEFATAPPPPFVVFHDAYQYFEAHFGFAAAGAISLGDATAPSPARIAEVRDRIADLGAACVFSEPQFNPGLVDTVFEGSAARRGVIDPLGTTLPTGPDFYPALLRTVGAEISACD